MKGHSSLEHGFLLRGCILKRGSILEVKCSSEAAATCSPSLQDTGFHSESPLPSRLFLQSRLALSRKAVCWLMLGTDLVGKGTYPGCAISAQQGTSPSPQGREGHWLYGVLGMEQEGPCLLCQASPAPLLCSHITERRKPIGLFLPTLPSPAFCLHRCSLSLL